MTSQNQTSAFVPADVWHARAGVAVTFFLTGLVAATWASRLPAIKQDLDLSDGQLAIAFMGLNAGAIAGLQIGGVLVPRFGSRPALRLALPAIAVALVAIGLASNLLVLTSAMFVWACTTSIVDVGMNAHGVAVEHRYRRPILSSLHAMHPLGGLAGGGIGAIAAWLSVGLFTHFGIVAIAVTIAAIVATRLLLPAAIDADMKQAREQHPANALATWFRGWSSRTLVFGSLAFCVTLAEGSALDWGAVYLHDSLDSSASLAAIGVAVFLGGVALGRFAGDGLMMRYGPVAMFRTGALVAGIGFGGALIVGTPIAGLAGLLLFGAGLSFLVPLLFSAAAKLPGQEPAAAIVARISTLAYLGSFVGPGLIGPTASWVGLPVALALPVALVLGTALVAGTISQQSTRPEDSRKRAAALGR
jgi:fucose permease